ncbi:MAG: hypothetical protein Q9192_006115 [Flavoplaca navasiana]
MILILSKEARDTQSLRVLCGLPLMGSKDGKSLWNPQVMQHRHVRVMKKLPECPTGQEQAPAQQRQINDSVIWPNRFECRTFSKRIGCQYFNLPETLGIEPFQNMSTKTTNISGTGNRKKYPVITPLKLTREIGETLTVSSGRTTDLETDEDQRYALMEAKKQETVCQSHLTSLDKATEAQRDTYVEERHRYQEQAREQTNRSRAIKQEVAQLERQVQTEERRRKAMEQETVVWR